MAWDTYMKGKSQFGNLGGHTMAVPEVLKEQLMNGKVRIYEDSKKTVMKTEILVKEGSVAIYKEFFPAHNIWRFKKIDILSLENEPLDSIDIFTENDQFLHPHSRFMYRGAPIGNGDGDIDKVIAQKILSEESIDSRLTQNSQLDQEVIDTILKILHEK